MKIAIHHREGSFSDRWISYCESNAIQYLIVNCYDSNIISILKDEEITHLMWHFSHLSTKDIMVFSYVLNGADKMGIKTFPNFNTRWHFDDKVAQKYLLESINAPYIESYVFYNKTEALNFIKATNFPTVAKLKGGAGSTNVKLITNGSEAKAYIEKLFGVGIKPINKPLDNLDQKLKVAKKIKNPVYLLKKTVGFIKRTRKERALSDVEKGYVYFQKFLPNNEFDTRIVVVGEIAFGIRRFTHENDFRASGSGKIDYDTGKIDTRMVTTAFEISDAIGAQSLAYDFVYDENSEIKVIEVCFGFSMKAYDKCEGYWSKDLKFTAGDFNPQEFMIKDFTK